MLEFNKDEFMNYLKEEFPTVLDNHWSWETVENVVDFALENKAGSEKQFSDFISFVLAEVEPDDVLQFCKGRAKKEPSRNQLCKRLCDNAKHEQDAYIDALLKLPPKDIIAKSYEKSIRDDIINIFQYGDLSEKQIKALAKLKNPVAECYNSWSESDYSHAEILTDIIRDFINEEIKYQEMRNER